MFSFLSMKEKGILLIGPIVLVLIILFQSWQANHWHEEMVKEQQLKTKWQTAYLDLNQNIAQFAEQQQALTQAVQQLKTEQHNQTQELKNALKAHPDWADGVIPDDIIRLLNPKPNTH